MYYLIYKITNNVNNKIYIGKHQTEDKNDDYIGSGKILKRAIEKYGLDKFTKEILFECNSLEEMNEKEAEIVDEEFVARLDTYNVKLGGQGGWDFINQNNLNHTGEHNFDGLKKHNELLKVDKDYYDKWYLSFINNYDSKISVETLLNYQKLNGNPFKNKKHTNESKAKIGKANSIHQQGENNSQYVTCWIYNEETQENKKIKKEELELYIKNGWIKGRKIKNNK